MTSSEWVVIAVLRSGSWVLYLSLCLWYVRHTRAQEAGMTRRGVRPALRCPRSSAGSLLSSNSVRLSRHSLRPGRVLLSPSWIFINSSVIDKAVRLLCCFNVYLPHALPSKRLKESAFITLDVCIWIWFWFRCLDYSLDFSLKVKTRL